ncbi:DUF120 domain-containing protein [Desulfurococcus mucosus]|uniref:Riboflavin kinase n=1 Tax=Desulfurococcus mucosus (strain ATCC 35584 / DSM 2162 / JCM 9187 / O7/1) TaxID=765177 RepID=E8R6Z8_DESM0|nr:DUF120 domain-containing protein [Desulfurococcus mucosus]ADV64431.1 protein of unknown function DUF120 [Desulfurococcus mucosus DSM 2162]
MEASSRTRRARTLRGRVIEGLGEGCRYISLYRDAIRRALGIEPYPGTLNIELIDPPVFNINMGEAIRVESPGPEYGDVLAVKAWINSIPVYIIRPVKTRHPASIIEVVSQHNLRRSLGIRTGDIIEIQVEEGSHAPKD